MRHLLRASYHLVLYLRSGINDGSSLPHLWNGYLRSGMPCWTIRQLYFIHVPFMFKFLQNLRDELAELPHLRNVSLWLQPLLLQQ